VSFATAKRHPMCLALKNDGIAHFYDNFIHMTAANIDALQCRKWGALVPLEMNFKMMLGALLAFFRHMLHKNRGGAVSMFHSAQSKSPRHFVTPNASVFWQELW